MRAVTAIPSKEYPKESCPKELETIASSKSTTATYLRGLSRRYGLFAGSPKFSRTR